MNIKHVSEVTEDQVNRSGSGHVWDSHQLLSTLCYRVNNYKYFDDMIKNSCEGGDWRCIGAEGPCGCWRNDHTFPADTVCDV